MTTPTAAATLRTATAATTQTDQERGGRAKRARVANSMRVSAGSQPHTTPKYPLPSRSGRVKRNASAKPKGDEFAMVSPSAHTAAVTNATTTAAIQAVRNRIPDDADRQLRHLDNPNNATPARPPKSSAPRAGRTRFHGESCCQVPRGTVGGRTRAAAGSHVLERHPTAKIRRPLRNHTTAPTVADTVTKIPDKRTVRVYGRSTMPPPPHDRRPRAHNSHL
jgi:hypothetical protein